MSTTSARHLRPGAAAVLLLATTALLGSCSIADDPEPRLADLDFEPVATLVVDDSGFDTDELQLVAGDSITVVNEGDGPHSFVITDPFRDTGEVLPGESVLLRFDEVDELEGHDGTDPEATVTIVVAERPEDESS
jgi:plastocyanin